MQAIEVHVLFNLTTDDFLQVMHAIYFNCSRVDADTLEEDWRTAQRGDRGVSANVADGSTVVQKKYLHRKHWRG